VIGPDLGPMGGYGALSGGARLFLSWLMLLGRLEFLAPLVLMMPSFWRR
jgi:trk system potassium uptake protein TrkH